MLIKLHPSLVAPDTIASIIIMGGAAGSGGNQWVRGEFNAVYDPEAMAIVMYSPVKVVMAGLNVTHQGKFSLVLSVLAKRHREADFVLLVQPYLLLTSMITCFNSMKQPLMTMVDPSAAPAAKKSQSQR